MAPKRTVVHLIQSLNTGGCETKLLRTLPLLADDFNQVIITLKERGNLAPRFEAKGIRVITIGLKGLTDGQGINRLISEIKSVKPSLIITYLFHADFVGRLFVQRRLPIPVVPSLVTTYNFARYLPARLFERATKGLVNHYLANSPAVKDYYVANVGVKPDKITVIPNGIDTAVFDAADRKKVRSELKLQPNTFVVTCVANLAANKGHRYLLEAMAGLQTKYPDSVALIAGTGQEERALKELAQSLGIAKKVFFLGRRNDIPDVLAASNAFVLPTLFEGMSIAIMEAMAAKVAVVTTDIPENRALVTNNQTGLLVPVNTALPIQEALERLASQPTLRTKLANQARRSIEKNFELKAVAKQWLLMINRFAKAN